MKRTALVVGAGVGGLAAAIALRESGWNVRIFERAARARQLGFGLGMAPNAIAGLRRLGVADTVLARGFAPTRGEIRRMDGTVLKRPEVPSPEALLGGPMIVASRSALHGALLESVGRDAVTFGSEITGFTADDGRVTIHAATGDTAEGDMLIGADGVGSATRRVLHPSEPPPRPCGIIAVRGASGAAHHLGDLSGVMYLGPGLESVLVRSGGTGVYWYLSLAREVVPSDTRDPEAILAHYSPRMDATFRAVTSHTEEFRCDELADRDPLPHWGHGVVTLLGDAAHPVLPHTGQGAAQAIVDAVALGQALSDGMSVPDALRSYELERRPKTAVLVAQGRRTARVMRVTNPVACGLLQLAIRLAPVRLLTKVYTRLNRRAGTDVTSAGQRDA
ncbi:MAG: FAD-dependent monooxygenase [Gammaproteobacteria bacterium]|nr:FAD-dependent monooxygenase [Gammaproteobacteria bacterium]